MNIQEEILTIVKNNPRCYPTLIKKNQEFMEWIYKNTLVETDIFIENLYSAIFQDNGVCSNGRKKNLRRFNEGFVGCGPAAVCLCTRENISQNVTLSKQRITSIEKSKSNSARSETMIKKYGVAYNSQREEIKHIWKRPKIPSDIYNKLISYEWMHTEYIEKKRTAIDIAKELKIYYSTVIEYCHKHNFHIRQRSNYSLIEKSVESFINSLGIDCETGNWSILGEKEIDIVIHDKHLAIEIDGLYWHSYNPSTQAIEDKEKHLIKTITAKEQGYHLLHITDWEWQNKQDIVKSIIKSKIGVTEKIYARKCVLKVVTANQVRDFYNNNHLQGFIGATYHIGLYYNNELVEAISIGTPRFNKNFKWELHRLCTKQNITVVGGASKLIKYGKKLINNELLLSYCDRSYSDGAGYIAIGFTLIEESEPGYFWTNGTEVIPRYKTVKSELAKWLPKYDPTISESENMFNNKFRRFSTCGNLVFKI